MRRHKDMAFRYELYDYFIWGESRKANEKLEKFRRKNKKGFTWFLQDCFEKDGVKFDFSATNKVIYSILNEDVAKKAVYALWKNVNPQQEEECKKLFLRTIDMIELKESKSSLRYFLLAIVLFGIAVVGFIQLLK